MLPSKFVEAANFPARWQEKDLQEYLAERLRRMGFHTQTEVAANGGRADIVSNWQGGTIVEVKKYLDRNSIYQAFGQLSLYGLNNQHKLIVMGFLTVDASEQPSALKTASMIEQNPRIKVIFVNLESEWLPNRQVGRFWLPNIFSLPKISLPKLPLSDWRFLMKIVKDNPLLIVLVIALLSIITSNLKQEFTRCYQQQQNWDCVFSSIYQG
ncbi:MAG: hypothetical protein KME21_29090 [Desmonostoc vinosum HA7617-LM4]|jgi:hypothetical protein|nr:hypothetical protein [Desmonostoc vinosum HA7617-LM4]